MFQTLSIMDAGRLVRFGPPGSVEHVVGLWHAEAQAQRAHSRNQLGSDASDRMVFAARQVELCQCRETT